MDSRLIEKFFRGACSPEEVEAVLAWFEEEEPGRNQEQDLSRLWQQAGNEKDQKEFASDKARILADIHQEIGLEAQTTVVADSRERRGPASWQWLYKVAAVLVLSGCLLWLYSACFASRQKLVSRLVTREARQGMRQVIRLADGSRITLNAGSRISYQEPFPDARREVTLSGEAYFEVAEDRRRPFRVQTGQLTTQALGTAFNIRSHRQDPDIAVALAAGAVNIENSARAGSEQLARLKPGQQLVYNREDQGYQVSTYDPLEVLGWRKGILHFKKASLSQVVARLERWYGIKIEITGKQAAKEEEWLYTGTYDNQRLDDVLAGISFVKDFYYEKKGNTMVLKFN